MAAPNIETLLDIETNIETAAKGFLQQATGLASTSAFASLDQDDLVLPRFSVKMELGEALDPPDIHATALLEYLKYTGELVIQIVTDASTDGSQADHRKYRGLTRGEMLRNACNFSNTNLPYYDVNYLRPSGTTFEVDGNLAISTLSFAIQLKIKDDAFPTLGSPNYRTTSATATTSGTSSATTSGRDFPYTTALTSTTGSTEGITTAISTIPTSATTFTSASSSASGTQGTSISTTASTSTFTIDGSGTTTASGTTTSTATTSTFTSASSSASGTLTTVISTTSTGSTSNSGSFTTPTFISYQTTVTTTDTTTAANTTNTTAFTSACAT